MKKWEKPMIQKLGLSYTEEEVSFYGRPNQGPNDGIDSDMILKICYCDQNKYTHGTGCGHAHDPENSCPKDPVSSGYVKFPMCS